MRARGGRGGARAAGIAARASREPGSHAFSRVDAGSRWPGELRGRLRAWIARLVSASRRFRDRPTLARLRATRHASSRSSTTTSKMPSKARRARDEGRDREGGRTASDSRAADRSGASPGGAPRPPERDTGIKRERDMGIDFEAEERNEVDAEGNTYFPSRAASTRATTGTSAVGPCRAARSRDEVWEHREAHWEKADACGYKELDAEELSGFNEEGDTWWETWREVYLPGRSSSSSATDDGGETADGTADGTPGRAAAAAADDDDGRSASSGARISGAGRDREGVAREVVGEVRGVRLERSGPWRSPGARASRRGGRSGASRRTRPGRARVHQVDGQVGGERRGHALGGQVGGALFHRRRDHVQEGGRDLARGRGRRAMGPHLGETLDADGDVAVGGEHFGERWDTVGAASVLAAATGTRATGSERAGRGIRATGSATRTGGTTRSRIRRVCSP